MVRRSVFFEQGQIALSSAQRDQVNGPAAVLLIDIDGLRDINIALGHSAGDEAVTRIAERISTSLGSHDFATHLGGDEFAVLLPLGGAEAVVDKIRLPQPGSGFGPPRDEPSVSVGAAVDLDQNTPLVDLVLRADVTVRAVKQQGRGIFDTFDPDRHGDSLTRARVAASLSTATADKEIQLRYQPIFDLATGKPVLMEASVEWLSSASEPIEAHQLFSLSAELGLESELTHRVLLQACQDTLSWQRVAGYEQVGLVVELPTGDPSETDGDPGEADVLVAAVDAALTESGMGPEHLVLDVTRTLETVSGGSRRRLTSLAELGVEFTIGDVDTAQSTRELLPGLTVDSIGVDHSAVSTIGTSAASKSSVRAARKIANGLGVEVTAGCIEQAEQVWVLQQLGCARGQGPFFAPPLPLSRLLTFCRDNPAIDVPVPVKDLNLAPLAAFPPPPARPAPPPTADVDSGEAVGRPPVPPPPADRQWWRLAAPPAGSAPPPRPGGLPSGFVPSGFVPEVLVGLDAFNDLADELDALAKVAGMPLMARSGWLRLWFECFGNWTSLMVTVRDSHGKMAGMAPLAMRRRDGETDIVAAGHGVSFFTGMPIAGRGVASVLASAMARHIETMPKPWKLHVEQLPHDDRVGALLAAELRGGQLSPERRVPRLVFSTAHSVEDVIGHTNAMLFAEARSRLKDDGIATYVGFDHGGDITDDLIDELQSVRLARDHELYRTSDLDVAARRTFWRGLLAGRPGHWEAEVATVRFDGEVAGYVAAVVDGNTYRIFDGRSDGRFEQYRPGHLVEAAALRRALTDDRLAAVDWMSKSGAGDLLAANMADVRRRVVADSSD